MKKLFLAILTLPLLLTGCVQSTTPSDSGDTEVEHYINVPINDVSMVEGEQYQIPIEILKKTIIVCRSNNEDIVTVTHSGLITAVKEGETTITVSGGQDHFIVFVTVSQKTAEDSLQIVMPKYEYTMKSGDTFNLPLSVKYGDVVVNNYTLSYEYEIDGVVSISNLTITASTVGITRCVVTATYLNLEASEIFTITVY